MEHLRESEGAGEKVGRVAQGLWLGCLGRRCLGQGQRDGEGHKGAAGKQAKQMQAQAGRSHPEPHVLPSGPDRACNQPEEECLHREALWEARGCSLIWGFSLRPSHVEVTDNFAGSFAGKRQ